MPNLSDIFFRTLIDGTQTDVYISGLKTPWNGTGTPWTAAATSPYEIAMNDRTGQRWTPKAAQPTAILSGGSLPTVLDRVVAPITETLPIQIWATTYDNAMKLKSLLQRVLTNQTYAAPVTLWVKPYGATQYVVYDILDGVIQELPAFINEEAGHGFLRTTVTITRQAWGVSDTEADGFTLNPRTYGNSPLESIDNINAFAATTVDGDLRYAGQPLNLECVPLSSTTVSRLWLATVADTQDPTTSDGTSYSTTSTTGVTKRTITIASTTAMNMPVKPRAMVRLAAISGPAEFRIIVQSGSSTSSTQTTLYTSAWQAAPATTSAMLDFGTWPMDLYRNARTPFPFAVLSVQMRSTTGASASAQINWLQLLWYYDFCRIDAALSSDFYLRIDQYTDSTAFHPRLVPPTATIYDRVNQTPVGFADVRGTLPRYRAGTTDGGLWAIWQYSTGVHVLTDQMTIYARFLPIFASLRGAA